VTDATGRILIAQRPAGKHLAGGWEFPGGKPELREFVGLREAVPIPVFVRRIPLEVAWSLGASGINEIPS
jgi:hypothetical protein